MILAFVGILIYVIHEPEIVDWKAVESEWYTETPYQNKLTFYEDGTYESESWGAPTGTWEALDNHTRHLIGNGTDLTLTLHDGVLEFEYDYQVYTYYADPAAIPTEEEPIEDPGLFSLRVNSLIKMLEQGEWENADGHTLSGKGAVMTLDGKDIPFRVKSIDTSTEKLIYEVTTDSGAWTVKVSCDEDLRYVLEVNEMIFEADGSEFRLDS